jgi:hypothetical protein
MIALLAETAAERIAPGGKACLNSSTSEVKHCLSDAGPASQFPCQLFFTLIKLRNVYIYEF